MNNAALAGSADAYHVSVAVASESDLSCSLGTVKAGEAKRKLDASDIIHCK